MNKFKVSHEVPLCLLEDNKKWSDYEYILPHHLDLYPEYEKHIRNIKNEGRYIIMDNSLHEMMGKTNEPYSEERLLHWVNELKPNEFIVPDLWENMIGTYLLAKEWKKRTDLPSETTLVAVIQAKSFDSAKELYSNYKLLGYEKIAFSYGAEYFNKLVPHPNRHLGKALGRIQTINKLYADGTIQDEDRIHLLGCQIPQEFNWYTDMSFIETIDTSNPIMAGYEHTFYNSYGLNTKPKTKIDDIIDISYDDIEPSLNIIKYNLNKFKSINNLI